MAVTYHCLSVLFVLRYILQLKCKHSPLKGTVENAISLEWFRKSTLKYRDLRSFEIRFEVESDDSDSIRFDSKVTG